MRKDFMVQYQGKEFVLYAGLLELAHREGLKRVHTRLLQTPSEENGQVAICLAEIETTRGTFTGIGDASPRNVGRMVASHTIRMAETRAKARALRDAVNVGVTAIEELGDLEEPLVYPETTLKPQAAAASIRNESRPGPRSVRSTISVVPNGNSEIEPVQPASSEQISRLTKLQRSLGLQATVPPDLSFGDAASQITELVLQFNAQARTGRAQREQA